MIGVFDSGLGGLSVLAALIERLPDAGYCYVADTAHAPYGPRTEAEIGARVLAIGDALVERGARLVVVACNTATVAAVDRLRARHPGLPVVGVEPGVKPAAASSRSGQIAVLATESTARSKRLAELIATHAQGVRTHVVACPGWATHVEQLQLEDPALRADVVARVGPLLDAGVDRLVLGCTHYSFLVPLLAPLCDGRAELVDVAAAVARQVGRLYPQGASCAGGLALGATAQPQRLLQALPTLGLGALVGRAEAPFLLSV